MNTDFRSALEELRAEEKRLQGELDVVRASIPGLEFLMRRDQPKAVPPMARFSGMGVKEAITQLLTDNSPLMPSDITRFLLEGGIQTRAADFVSTVASTLNSMKADGLVERVENGWRLSRVVARFDGGRGMVMSNGTIVSSHPTEQ